MKRTILPMMVAILLLSVVISSMQAQITQTHVTQGDIAGEVHEGYVVYKGIPYAEAPVGRLRWKLPVPKKSWKGVYQAIDWKNTPWQPVNSNQGSLPLNEDCLYLGIQTPAKTINDSLPVFVMIHGGAFQTGHYDGTQDSYMKEGIVYVSIEYRLGALGFMAHPELTKENQGTSGNFGIYDQICALRWIHDNIAAFGGDPNKVTICGESAGGISVSILCASPLCKGLFRAAISESGGSLLPPAGGSMCAYTKPLAEAEVVGESFQEMLGKKNLKALRKAPASDLIAATKGEMFWPVVDGKAITGDIYQLYQEGNYNDVDVMVGYNSDEGSLFVYEMTMDDYTNMLMQQFGGWYDRAMKAYPANTNQEALYAVQDIFRDNTFGWPTWAWANLQSQTGTGHVYMYYFAQHSDNSIIKDCGGATHVAEMPFAYGWTSWGKMTAEEENMSAVMQQYWINFIKYGDPNGAGLPEWSTYKQGEPTVMYMQDGFRLTPAPNEAQMHFWEKYLESRRK